MNKDFYTYPALLSFDVPGDVGITFPDFIGCTGQCKADTDILSYAQETLIFHLSSMLEDGEEIPEPTPMQDIKFSPEQAIMPVRIYMPQFMEHIQSKSDNRTVTLPHWLNTAAKDAGINFSQLLQDAIMQKLGVSRDMVITH